MRLFILFTSAFLSLVSYSQTTFVGDSESVGFSRISKIYSVIDSSFNLNKDNDFEFRLWTLPSLTTYSTVFILCQKQGKWNGRYFEYRGNQKRNVFEIPVNQTSLDSLWKRLLANQVLTLPTQDSIRGKMKIFIADTSYVLEEDDMYKRSMMTDGTVYRVELLKGNLHRSYEYHCPQGYLKLYPNVEELYRAFSIIILIRKYLGLTLSVC